MDDRAHLVPRHRLRRCAYLRGLGVKGEDLMSNPYQPFFDQMDECVAALEDNGSKCEKEAASLLRRAGFVLANLLNVNAQVLPSLILPVEGEVASVEADSDPPSTT